MAVEHCVIWLVLLVSISSSVFLHNFGRERPFESLSGMKMSIPSEWDEELGIWKNFKATCEPGDLPSPLYVFGYGSLIWRPDLLEPLPSFRCTALGWKRVFAMRSCDHRGTAEFPGLVLNMASDELLRDLGYLGNDASVECDGLIWLIPPEKTDEIIAELDYRERGGYHRHSIKVRLHSDTPHHTKGQVIDVLVYTGQRTNPNFFLRPNRNLLRSSEDIFLLHRRNVVTDIIAASRGPSGPNVDYLFNLEYHLAECGMPDSYLVRLAESVRYRLGPWRSRLHTRASANSRKELGSAASVVEEEEEGEEADGSARGERSAVLGCGSNEFHQLGAVCPSYLASVDQHHYFATPVDGAAASGGLGSFVSAGGGSSALIEGGVMTLWGKLVPAFLAAAGEAAATNRGKIVVEGVSNVALGHDHCLLLLTSGRVVAVGSNSHGQCNTPQNLALTGAAFTNVNEATYRIAGPQNEQGEPSARVLKLAVGLRHSAAITDDGCLLTWGDGSFGQASSERTWKSPQEGATLVDLACGAKHTVVIDSSGAMYSVGSNKHCSLGRALGGGSEDCVIEGRRRADCSGELRAVDFRPDVRWQHVSSGWSHCVARGILPSGELVFYGWGRRDMGQFPADEAEGSSEGGWHSLKALPSGEDIVEVWAGSEFTLAADAEGRLWGCGWNEHGNLGNGDAACGSVSDWQPVLNQEGATVRLSRVWEGAVACGGGHVLLL